MKNLLFVCAMSACLLTVSCKGNKTRETVKERETVTYTNTPEGMQVHDAVKGKVTNKDGKTLHYSFDNSTRKATFDLDGEKIEMMLDTTKASGANYRNEHYTFTDWHGQVELKKDGKVIFSHKDEMLSHTVKGTNGKEAQMNFNNTRGLLTMNYDGEVIDLKQDTVASGMKYSNSMYELVEHQGKGELLKNGKVVFTYNNR